MATLSALKFDSPDGAVEMLGTLELLQRKQLIEIQDAAMVTWRHKVKKPITRRLDAYRGIRTLSGVFWGLLFGEMFFIPLSGAAGDAVVRVLAGYLQHCGIDEEFIKTARARVMPGTSALFLLTGSAVVDPMAAAVQGIRFEIIQTDVSQEGEEKLREAFGEETTLPIAA